MAKKEYGQKDIIRRLGELAFGRANDLAKLAMMDGEAAEAAVDGLDLSLLSEYKRSAGGVVEVKACDRLKALEMLNSVLASREAAKAASAAEDFLRAISGAADGDERETDALEA